MKKTIAILLVLVIGMVGVFAAPASALGEVDDSTPPVAIYAAEATITVKTTVEQFALFGVTAAEVAESNFATKALFSGAVENSLTKNIEMLNLGDALNPVEVGKLSGINNTTSAVTLYIHTTALTSGSNSVALTVSPTSKTIPAAASSAFGTLKNESITVTETSSGTAALAPAGSYEATITINLVSGS